MGDQARGGVLRQLGAALLTVDRRLPRRAADRPEPTVGAALHLRLVEGLLGGVQLRGLVHGGQATRRARGREGAGARCKGRGMDVKRSVVLLEVSLSRDDLRLVGLGLSGKLRDRADQEAARDLNERLLRARRRVVEEELTLVDGALAGLGPKEGA